jgi:hypothetical protein
MRKEIVNLSEHISLDKRIVVTEQSGLFQDQLLLVLVSSSLINGASTREMIAIGV